MNACYFEVLNVSKSEPTVIKSFWTEKEAIEFCEQGLGDYMRNYSLTYRKVWTNRSVESIRATIDDPGD